MGALPAEPTVYEGDPARRSAVDHGSRFPGEDAEAQTNRAPAGFDIALYSLQMEGLLPLIHQQACRFAV